MSTAYTRFHPRWHRSRTPIFWWVRRRAYTRFIARELTSLFVAYGALLLVAWAWAVGRGPEAWAAFSAWLARPGVMAFHVGVLAVLVFHSVTWLNLAPQALALRVGKRRVPGGAVLAAHYLAWATASLAVVAGALVLS